MSDQNSGTPPKTRKLTAKERCFVENYILDLNATKAALRAGYSRTSARQIASRLMSKDYIQAAITAGMEARAREVQIASYLVLEELKNITTADIGEAFDSKGVLLPFDQMPEYLRRAIASVEVEELFEYVGGDRVWTGYTKKIKLWPKVPASELLGRHMGTFDKKDKNREKPLREFKLKYSLPSKKGGSK